MRSPPLECLSKVPSLSRVVLPHGTSSVVTLFPHFPQVFAHMSPSQNHLPGAIFLKRVMLWHPACLYSEFLSKVFISS